MASKEDGWCWKKDKLWKFLFIGWWYIYFSWVDVFIKLKEFIIKKNEDSNDLYYLIREFDFNVFII